jgi:hypothetical protein
MQNGRTDLFVYRTAFLSFDPLSYEFTSAEQCAQLHSQDAVSAFDEASVTSTASAISITRPAATTLDARKRLLEHHQGGGYRLVLRSQDGLASIAACAMSSGRCGCVTVGWRTGWRCAIGAEGLRGPHSCASADDVCGIYHPKRQVGSDLSARGTEEDRGAGDGLKRWGCANVRGR